MADTKSYEFPRYMQQVYGSVLRWLDGRPEARGYKAHNVDLDSDAPVPVAAHFHRLFPAHYFKVARLLDEALEAKLANWLEEDGHICFVDVGCGTGCASAAFVEAVVKARTERRLRQDPVVVCLGVDPSRYALALYDQVMRGIEGWAPRSHVVVQHKMINAGVPLAERQIAQDLRRVREEWGRPYLPRICIAQVNVVRPIWLDHSQREEARRRLLSLGVDETSLVDGGDREYAFGVALCYLNMMVDVPIDRVLLLTVATTQSPLWGELVDSMQHAVDAVFVGGCSVERLQHGELSVAYSNPRGSHYREQGIRTHAVSFPADVSLVTGADWQKDEQWLAVVAPENLMLAWARARRGLLNESLVDEIEIRLFERDLDANLDRLRRKLLVYAQDVMDTSERLPYRFPKSMDETRPRVLSRMEEEIVSVAVIQALGQAVSGRGDRSYAYRLNRGAHRETEYLYDRWFDRYEDFRRHAREAAQKCVGGIVMRFDVEGFFTNIVQAKLVDLCTDELNVRSERLTWLLNLLLRHDLPCEDHQAGRGITQGGLGSGFYANLYLARMDSLLGANHPCKVTFVRYVDDMIAVVPDPEDADRIEAELTDGLEDLGLRLNREKTERCSVEEYLARPDQDEFLTGLSDRVRALQTQLYIANAFYRTWFQQVARQDDWWAAVGTYQRCLQGIGFFSDVAYLSRRVWPYLGDDSKVQKDLHGKPELKLPWVARGSLPQRYVPGWAASFEAANPGWVQEKDALRQELAALFWRSVSQLTARDALTRTTARQTEASLRFSVHRLCRLGLADIHEEVTKILCATPWLLSEPRYAIEALCRQGYGDDIVTVLSTYQRDRQPVGQYMCAVILRALRHLPTISEAAWQALADAITSPDYSLPERLMAMETWLILAAEAFEEGAPIRDLPSLEILAQEDDLPLRLEKNRVLVVGMYGQEHVPSPPHDADSMLAAACEMAVAGDMWPVLSSPEPEIIRTKYYSGQYPEFADDSLFSL